MVSPVFALLFHLLSTPRSQLEFVAAGALLLAALLYMTRLVRSCFAIGLEVDGERQMAAERIESSQPEKPSNEPYCAG